MAKDATNVLIGVIGELFYAPAGTTVPTDADTALDAAFIGLGYATEDGLTRDVTESTADIKAWGGDTVRSVRTDFGETFSISLMESKAEVFKTFYGDTSATATSTSVAAGAGRVGMWAIDMLDGTRSIRVFIPNGQVTTTGSTPYKTGEAMVYPITISAYPDGSGKVSYRFFEAAA